MAYSLISHTSVKGSTPVTTSAIDTTGADLLIVVAATFAGNGTVSDSKSNTWTGLTQRGGTQNARVCIFYNQGGTVGTSHTFTLSDSNPDIFVAAFSGSTASPADQENGTDSGTSGTSRATGSITPTVDNCLVIAGLCLTSATSGVPTIDSGFTITDATQRNNAEAGAGGGLAYLIQTTAAAANPTWSWATSAQSNAAIASFKAASGGGGRTTKNTRHTELGVDTGQNMWGHL